MLSTALPPSEPQRAHRGMWVFPFLPWCWCCSGLVFLPVRDQPSAEFQCWGFLDQAGRGRSGCGWRRLRSPSLGRAAWSQSDDVHRCCRHLSAAQSIRPETSQVLLSFLPESPPRLCDTETPSHWEFSRVAREPGHNLSLVFCGKSPSMAGGTGHASSSSCHLLGAVPL